MLQAAFVLALTITWPEGIAMSPVLSSSPKPEEELNFKIEAVQSPPLRRLMQRSMSFVNWLVRTAVFGTSVKLARTHYYQ